MAVIKKKKPDDPAKAAKSTVNMTPMIDVTFQLIVVFLCSMKFKTLDMKIEAFLPKDVGLSAANPTSKVETKLQVRLKWDKKDKIVTVLLQDNRLGTTTAEGVWTTLAGKLKEFKSKSEEIKAEIDAANDVPHGDVMKALDSFLAAGYADVVFRGTPFNETGRLGAQPTR
jgi:biopolymer transport protein ExbD